ncbi:hypothetical protein HFO56_00035 [Rhizobium laguerreae]|uniref:hypothetical protein n=1 Tax=Rhizobium laguerreae TaxID=1076926 RepID=UPI001C8FB765|nr:hypothetical protein [Rhizobium laguerreae]MBY3150816.1 hypothetical protein [Rhizobium laguerreae]
MKTLIEDIIEQLEELEGPSKAVEMEIMAATMSAFRHCTSSVDGALDLAVLAPGWYISRAGDNARGEPGNMRVFGHTAEYTNEVERVQGDAPTKPLAYCLAILKAYLSSWEESEKALLALLDGDTRVSTEIKADVRAVISNIVTPFRLPDAEIDEDDQSIVLRWTGDGNETFSLTFLGKGFVAGCLSKENPSSPAWRRAVDEAGPLQKSFRNSEVTKIISLPARG